MTKIEELQERAATKLEQELPQAPKMQEVIPYLRERAAANADNYMALLDDKKTLAGAYAAIEAEASVRANLPECCARKLTTMEELAEAIVS